jgi:Holliday junction DNA helicase RuvA
VIASLNGRVLALESTSAVIDVAGVGYLVQITPATSRTLALDHGAFLFTAMIVREDGFTLFGFSTVAEQKVFDLLRSVSGVGPKSALAILGELSVDQIVDAVAQENDAAFKAVSGIGPKTAKLISVTLAGKLGNSAARAKSSTGSDLSVVVSALTGLGWNERSALDAASKASDALGSSASTNNLLKAALAQLGSSKSIGASDE